jgi:phosphonate degradation associated HDIG domain protein
MINTTIQNDPITNEIIQLFELHGNEDYDGEPVSQTSHMVQCAMHAMNEGGDTDLILGAFLHDIGHLLRHKQKAESMGSYGVVNHEGLGATYLHEKGFSDRICAMVEKHVDAKRYLVATDETYKSKLSEASLQTLEWQGGPMSEAEVILFKQHPFFDDIIRVRLWDEMGKSADAVMLPLQHFGGLIHQYLKDRNKA